MFGEFDNSVKGKVWGFSNFHSIWESICLTYLVKTVDPAFILYLDNGFISDKILSKLSISNKIIDIAGIFRVNGTDIFPDAVIFSSQVIEDSKKKLTTYKLRRDNYNDYYIYYTTFYEETTKENLRITYVNQPENYHTFDELSKFCKIDDDNLLSITSFPDKFYSYWDIFDEYEDITFQQIQMMYSLNHIFVVAFNNRFLCFEDFYQEFIELHDIFKSSLLRSSGGKEKRERAFQKFIRVTLNQFSIIDIKYSTSDYYTNSNNIEEIKSRSVRKQFIYEYLLQKHLEHTKNPLKELDIKSEFWLPDYSSPQETLTSLPKYMDDYIKLTGVNIMAVIDSYLETEEK